MGSNRANTLEHSREFKPSQHKTFEGSDPIKTSGANQVDISPLRSHLQQRHQSPPQILNNSNSGAQINPLKPIESSSPQIQQRAWSKAHNVGSQDISMPDLRVTNSQHREFVPNNAINIPDRVQRFETGYHSKAAALNKSGLPPMGNQAHQPAPISKHA